MACACSKNRARAKGTGTPAPSGTYRVMVNGRQVFETTSDKSANVVAAKFVARSATVTILKPGENA